MAGQPIDPLKNLRSQIISDLLHHFLRSDAIFLVSAVILRIGGLPEDLGNNVTSAT